MLLFNSDGGPSFYWEDYFIAGGFNVIAGVDEAGRGPLAGPVVAGAVIILDRDIVKETKIEDSKKLSEGVREGIFKKLTNSSGILWGVGAASAVEVDKYNVLNATFIAMKRAIYNLSVFPEAILVDGNREISECSISQRPVIKGDSSSFSVAAASIIAKVIRDRIMIRLDKFYPEYGWRKNKGYPTKEHKIAISRRGLTPHHRRSFSL